MLAEFQLPDPLLWSKFRALIREVLENATVYEVGAGAGDAESSRLSRVRPQRPSVVQRTPSQENTARKGQPLLSLTTHGSRVSERKP